MLLKLWGMGRQLWRTAGFWATSVGDDKYNGQLTDCHLRVAVRQVVMAGRAVGWDTAGNYVEVYLG